MVFKKDKEILGLFMPTTNKAIADFFFAYSEENSDIGKYLDWTYLDESAIVEGTCVNQAPKWKF